MNEPLRPSTLSEILDRTVQLYRSRFLVFLGISVVPAGVVLALVCIVAPLFVWWGATGAGSASAPISSVLALLFLVAVALVAVAAGMGASALALAALNHAVARAYLGETSTIRDAYKTIWRRGWRYLGLYVVQALLIWGVPFGAWVGMVLLTTGANALARRLGDVGAALLGLGAFLSFVTLVVYFIWMLLRLSLAFPTCVVEQIGVVQALKRSAYLSIGSRGRIFLFYLLGAVLSWIVSAGVTIPITILLALFPGSGSAQYAQAAAVVMTIGFYGSAFAVQSLIKPIFGIALMLFYYDQRIRLEGFDIEWMMQQAGLTVPATPDPGAMPAATETVQGIKPAVSQGSSEERI
jgi:hypothetical protein